MCSKPYADGVPLSGPVQVFVIYSSHRRARWIGTELKEIGSK